MKKFVFQLFILSFFFCIAGHAENINLNGTWKFTFKEGKTLSDIQLPNSNFEHYITVPGCFDALPQWSKKRGTAIYSKTFFLDKEVINAYLQIEGIGLRGKFYIDNKEMGEEHLPYSTFSLPTGKLQAGWHTIVALIDNTLDESDQSMFHQYYDFYTFGGFYHGVSLELQTDKIGFYKILVRTLDYSKGQVEIELLTRNSNVPTKVNAKIWFDHSNTPIQTTFYQGKTKIQVPNAKLWSPEQPNLHMVKVDAYGSSQTTRFGIREIKTNNGELLLNGKPITLKGVNRHESYPLVGSSTPKQIMLTDIQNLLSLGGNFIRGAHYPQCEAFLNLCDEMGVLVWEETLGWNNKAQHMKNSIFFKDQIRQLKMMAIQSINHPSIIITGFLNENKSNTQEGYQLISELVKTARSLNTGHLITFACNEIKNDICNELTDIVAFNTYPGWIGTQAGSHENLQKIVKNNVDEVISNFSKKYPGKAIMVSEMGTCGIYGSHDTDASQWTEEFQAEYVDAVMNATVNNPKLIGLCIWQFTDSPSYFRDGGTIRAKPFAQNLAGLYDAYRRPKAVVNVVKKYWDKH